jgi:hypothetical protein
VAQDDGMTSARNFAEDLEVRAMINRIVNAGSVSRINRYKISKALSCYTRNTVKDPEVRILVDRLNGGEISRDDRDKLRDAISCYAKHEETWQRYKAYRRMPA